MQEFEVEPSWNRGAWARLAEIDRTAIETSPIRVKLALIIAIAHLQRNDKEIARDFVELAIKWGCSDVVASKVLVAGVHNTLARAAALADADGDRIDHHFNQSVRLEDGEFDKQAACARAVSELLNLGLVEQAFRFTEESIGLLKDAFESQSVDLELLAVQRNCLQIKRWLLANPKVRRPVRSSAWVSVPQAHYLGQRLVLLVAGMRHSGSTALFNILRLGMESLGLPFESGYTEKLELEKVAASESGIFLLKTHEYRDDVAQLADFVFTTKRDLRDTVASAVRRKFPLCERLSAIEYSKYNRQLWEIWSELSDYEFHYETHMREPARSVMNVLDAVGLQRAGAYEIAKGINALPTDQYNVTLLSPTHITDPERKLTYQDNLTQEQVYIINRNNARWLEVNGYE